MNGGHLGWNVNLFPVHYKHKEQGMATHWPHALRQTSDTLEELSTEVYSTAYKILKKDHKLYGRPNRTAPTVCYTRDQNHLYQSPLTTPGITTNHYVPQETRCLHIAGSSPLVEENINHNRDQRQLRNDATNQI